MMCASRPGNDLHVVPGQFPPKSNERKGHPGGN